MTTHKSLPWITYSLRLLLRKWDQAYKKAKRTVSPTDWATYKWLRNKGVSMLRSAKQNFLMNLSTNLRSPKQFWSAYHSLSTNYQHVPRLLTNGSHTVESLSAKANMLNSYFTPNFSTCSNLPSTTPSPTAIPTLSDISCSNAEVYQLLKSLKIKTASGPDDISNRMLRGYASTISSYLSTLFNLSLSTGIVPTAWKTSNITPVYKDGDPKLVSNYCPISLLSIPSKLLERIIRNKLMNDLLSNSIISRQQFGFRPQSLTQEALLAATNDWDQYLDSNLSVGCVAFDLSKAFDSLPHPAILSNLSRVGIRGRLFDWFQNYLSNRQQKVVLDGHESSTAQVASGVPQGSILGPLLFTISMDPITSLSLSKDSNIILYADDILLYKPITSYNDAIALLQSDINMVTNWLSDCGLKLNPAKTKFMLISRKRFPPNLSVCIEGTPIIQGESLKYLGVTITSDLSWSTHINSTCTKARKQLSFLHRNFYQANHQSIAYLYKTPILRLLDYCCCMWDPHQSTYTAKLEKVQKFAAKLASGQKTTITFSHFSLLATRRQQQKLLLCRRILTGNSIIPPSIFIPYPAPDLRHSHNPSFVQTTNSYPGAPWVILS